MQAEDGIRVGHVTGVQTCALPIYRTVLENAQFGLEIQHMAKDEREKIAVDALKQVGLEGWEDAYPNQLSGGMQQRVGVARALATDGGVLRVDEAFSAMASLIRKDMQLEVQKLKYSKQKTTIY